VRFLAAVNSPRIATLALGVLLAAVGAVHQWIRFPISETVSGFSVGYLPFDLHNPTAAAPIPQGLTFLLVVLAAAVAGLMGRTRLRRFLAGLALAALFYHLLHLAFIDGQRIEMYVAEAIAYRRQFVILALFVPNEGLDIQERYPEVFEYLVPDRWLVVWAALGRGWILALAGALILAAVPDGRAAPRTAPLALVVAAQAAVLVLLVFGARPIWGQYVLHLGNSQLAQGDHAMALGSFADAMGADPMLRGSSEFMRKVSKAHYDLNGPREPYALLYLADADFKERKYDDGLAKLKILAAVPPGASPFRAYYLQAAAKTERDGYIARGMLKYRLGDKAQAERDFRRALGVAVTADPRPMDLNFMLARIEQDLRQYAACVGRAERLLATGNVADRTTRANLSSTAGDCYARMHEYARARVAYFAAFGLDDRTNYRAYQGLSGF